METKDLIKQEKNEIQKIDEKTILEYLQVFGHANKLTDNETRQFVKVAQMSNLNPFKNEIYCIKYKGKDGDNDKLSIVTGYEVYIKRAERLGALDGWEVEATGSKKDGNLKAKITIYRKDRSKPFIWTADFEEYNQNRNLWLSKPKTMLKKVAIAQGFRMCFPCDFDDLPYIEDELPNHMIKPEKKGININPHESIENEIADTICENDNTLYSNDFGIDYAAKLKEFRESDIVKGFSISGYPIGLKIVAGINNVFDETAPEYYGETCHAIADLLAVDANDKLRQMQGLLVFFATIPLIVNDDNFSAMVKDAIDSKDETAKGKAINTVKRLLK